MIDAKNVPDVDRGELLARYVLQSSHIRRSNQSVKPDAFVPHPYQDLSVTRHRDASAEEVWEIGQQVASSIGKTLHGRADTQALSYLRQKLKVCAAPIDDNPNHADVSGWPSDKPSQKILAQEIAAAARLIPTPFRDK